MADGEVVAKIFSKMDADNSGTICQSELNSAFKDFDKDGRLYEYNVNLCFDDLIRALHVVIQTTQSKSSNNSCLLTAEIYVS